MIAVFMLLVKLLQVSAQRHR